MKHLINGDNIQLGIYMRNTAAICLTLLGLLFYASSVQAAEHPHAKMCDKKIGVAVPEFSCQKDGRFVPKTITSGKCNKPEDLYTRCVFNSTLGRLSQGKDGKGVDIIFSCRKKPDSGKTYESDKSNTYFDIAAIQYNRETGDTCFYQHLGDTKQKVIPAPNTKAGADFWDASTENCTSCHANGPFIRSPNYAQVFMDNAKTDRLLPREQDIDDDKYNVLNSHWKVVSFDEGSNNVCLSCHNIGAYQARAGAKHRLGHVNFMASGTLKSLKGRWDYAKDKPKSDKESPTISGYHDYMVVNSYVLDDRDEGVAAVKELNTLLAAYDTCLKSPPAGGCKLEQPK